jgi:hypothetical protein
MIPSKEEGRQNMDSHVDIKRQLDQLDEDIAKPTTTKKQKAALEAQRPELMRKYHESLVGNVDHQGRRLP